LVYLAQESVRRELQSYRYAAFANKTINLRFCDSSYITRVKIEFPHL
jgi:hypothetical protein